MLHLETNLGAKNSRTFCGAVALGIHYAPKSPGSAYLLAVEDGREICSTCLALAASWYKKGVTK